MYIYEGAAQFGITNLVILLPSPEPVAASHAVPDSVPGAPTSKALFHTEENKDRPGWKYSGWPQFN